MRSASDSSGDRIIAIVIARNGDHASSVGPKAPKYAAIETTEATPIAPKPIGLKFGRCARLNSMYEGLVFSSGLLMTRSATTAPIQAIATFE